MPRGLGAEFTIFGAAAGLDVDDGAEVNFVALELGADAVGPGEEVVDVGVGAVGLSAGMSPGIRSIT